MKNTYRYNVWLGIFFVLAAVGMLVYFVSTAMTNTRASKPMPQSIKDKIEMCYEKRRGTCPVWSPELANSQDKKDKGCKLCHTLCTNCEVAKRLNPDVKCNPDCGAETTNEVFGDTPSPSQEPTIIPVE